MTELKHENNVTIDDLAIMIANGFRNVDKRFEAVEGRLDSLENRVNQMDMRLSSQLDNIVLNYSTKQEYSHLEKRVKKLELSRV